MANHSSLNGNNSNKTSGLAKAWQSNSAGSKCDKANGSDNATQPANRELELAFGIRMPQRKQRTAAEKRAMITPEMLGKALSCQVAFKTFHQTASKSFQVISRI